MALLPFSSNITQEPTIVDLLRKDHELMKRLFREFQSTEDRRRKGDIAREAITELEIHARAEEKVFYPAVRDDAPDAGSKLDESREEHHVARLLMKELSEMTVNDERFDPKFSVLIENVKHHLKEEEAEIFARARTGRLDLIALGKRLEAEKARLRTAPGRKRPAKPPQNKSTRTRPPARPKKASAAVKKPKKRAVA